MPNTADNPSSKAYDRYMHFTSIEDDADECDARAERAQDETDLHPLVEEWYRESLEDRKRRETNDTTTINQLD